MPDPILGWELKFNSGPDLQRINYILTCFVLLWGTVSSAQAPSSSWSLAIGLRPEFSISELQESSTPSYWAGLSYFSYAGRRHAWGGTIGYANLQRFRDRTIYSSVNYQTVDLSGTYRYWPLNEPGSNAFIQPFLEGALSMGITGIYSQSNLISGTSNLAYSGMIAVGADFRGRINQLGVKAGAGWQQIEGGPFPTFSTFNVNQHLHSVPYLHLSVAISWPKRKPFKGPKLASYPARIPASTPSTVISPDSIRKTEPIINEHKAVTVLPKNEQYTTEIAPGSVRYEEVLNDSLFIREPVLDSLLHTTPIIQDSTLTTGPINQFISDSSAVSIQDSVLVKLDSLGVPPEEDYLDSLQQQISDTILISPPYLNDSTSTGEKSIEPLENQTIPLDTFQQVADSVKEISRDDLPIAIPPSNPSNNLKLTSDTILIHDTIIMRDTIWMPIPLPEKNSTKKVQPSIKPTITNGAAIDSINHPVEQVPLQTAQEEPDQKDNLDLEQKAVQSSGLQPTVETAKISESNTPQITIVPPPPVIITVPEHAPDTVFVRDTLLVKDTLLTNPPPIPPLDTITQVQILPDTLRDSLPANSLQPGTQRMLMDTDSIQIALMEQENEVLRKEIEWLRAHQQVITEPENEPVRIEKVIDTVVVAQDNSKEISALKNQLKALQDSLAALLSRPQVPPIRTYQQIIYYATGTVAPDTATLNELLRFVNAHREEIERIDIRVYTDSRGSEQTNLTFSKRRGDYLKNALIKSGIPENKINVFAFGEQQAKVPADPLDRKAIIDIQYRED